MWSLQIVGFFFFLGSIFIPWFLLCICLTVLNICNCPGTGHVINLFLQIFRAGHIDLLNKYLYSPSLHQCIFKWLNHSFGRRQFSPNLLFHSLRPIYLLATKLGRSILIWWGSCSLLPSLLLRTQLLGIPHFCLCGATMWPIEPLSSHSHSIAQNPAHSFKRKGKEGQAKKQGWRWSGKWGVNSRGEIQWGIIKEKVPERGGILKLDTGRRK